MKARVGVVMAVWAWASLAWGDVVSTVSGSKLTLTGDETADSVAIERDSDSLRVTGLHGTLVDSSSDARIFPDVRRLKVKLGKGGDRVTLTDVRLPDGFEIRVGKGDDLVVLDDVDVGRSRIRTGNGRDDVRISSSRLAALSVLTGSGRDEVSIVGTWIPHDLHVDTGSGDDDVQIVGTDIGDDLDVFLGNDDDDLELADVTVDDDTQIDGQDGDDDLWTDGYVWFGDDLEIDGFWDDDWW